MQLETPPKSSAPDNGRTESGTFAPGNRLARGNPYNRRMAAYRRAMATALTPEMIGGVIKAMVREALKGDVAAGKLVLAYACGLPKVDISISGTSDLVDAARAAIAREAFPGLRLPAVVDVESEPDIESDE